MRFSRIFRIAMFSGALFFSQAAMASFGDGCCATDCGTCCEPANTIAEAGVVVGEGLGYESGYGRVALFHSPFIECSSWRPFFDIRGYKLFKQRWGASAGVGLRFIDECDCSLWGVNAYVDYYRGHRGPFYQAGVGLEALNYNICGFCLEARINGYIPFGSHTRHSKTHVFTYPAPSTAVVTCSEREHIYGGFDAEVGACLWECDCFSLFAAVGPYYYTSKGEDSFWGGRARAGFRWTEYVEVEVRTTYDKHFKSTVQGVFTLSVPFSIFDCCDHSCSPCDCVLYRPVFRNEIPVISRDCCYNANF